MSHNTTNMYDTDSHISEVYDQCEVQRDDVSLIRKLISGMDRLRILEPFCGQGRIFIPLAEDGHEIVGLDQAQAMLDGAWEKLKEISGDIHKRVTLIQADVTAGGWPVGFDLVILGGNCFYELATAREQESCIESAAQSLKPGGYLYLDNNHMEGELDDAWCEVGKGPGKAFPSGICKDGTILEGSSETIWFDKPNRLWRSRRSLKVTFPDGTIAHREWTQQKHPVSVVEQKEWLAKYGFEIIHLFGDRNEEPYTERSGRGIFWARKVKYE